MVTAHSGALAADDGGWEALARAYGVHRVGDLAELADALELFAIGRRAARRAGHGGRHGPSLQTGIATVHDSGLERAHAADLAEDCGVPFAAIGPATKARLADILDPGLTPANPLDVWGTGADTRGLFTNSLVTLAEDPSVDAVALAVDLVHELDGDESYRLAVLDAAAQTTKPLVVLGNVASAVDTDLATQLRQHGVPVLEGLRTGLLALRHLLDHAARSPPQRAGPSHPGRSRRAPPAPPRQSRASSSERASEHGGPRCSPRASPAGRRCWPCSPSTGSPRPPRRRPAMRRACWQPRSRSATRSCSRPPSPAIAHKSDVRGVILGIPGPAELARGLRRPVGQAGPVGSGLRERAARHRAGPRHRPRPRPRPADRRRRGRRAGGVARRPRGRPAPGRRAHGRGR